MKPQSSTCFPEGRKHRSMASLSFNKSLRKNTEAPEAKKLCLKQRRSTKDIAKKSYNVLLSIHIEQKTTYLEKTLTRNASKLNIPSAILSKIHIAQRILGKTHNGGRILGKLRLRKTYS